MTHEACRAAFRRLTAELVRQKELIQSLNGDSKQDISQFVNSLREAAAEKDKEIHDLKVALNAAQFHLWTDQKIAEDSEPNQNTDKKNTDERNCKLNLEYSDLECDGCPVDRPISETTHLHGSLDLNPQITTKDRQSTDKGQLYSKASTTESLDAQKSHRISLSVDARNLNEAKLQVQQHPKSLSGGSPVVSENFNQIISQNIRLKRIIYDLLDVRGITINDYLNKCEYEDTIVLLKQELRLKKSECDHLKQIIDNKDNKNVLQKTNKENLAKISKLERSVVLQKTLADAYNQQYNKVKAELTESRREHKKLEEKLLNLKILLENLEEGKLPCSIKTLLQSEVPVSQADQSQALLKQQQLQTQSKQLQSISKQQKSAVGSHSTVISGRSGVSADSKSTMWAEDVGVDGPPATVEQQTSETTLFECPRCDRPFTDEIKFSDHCRRCSD